MKHTNRQRLEMTLLLLMLATVIFVVLFRFLFQTVFHKEPTDASALPTPTSSSIQTGAASLTSGSASSASSSSSSIQTSQAPKAEAIVFDPNTADAETLQRVGFAPWQVKSIMNYRAKGGAYHRKEEVKRIYGMTYGLWEHLEPLIRIGRENQLIADHEDLSYHKTQRSTPSSAETAVSQATPSKTVPTPTTPDTRSNKLRKGETVDINLGDTALLQRIPGIGPKKASILSSYVKKLGGLASADQLNDDALHDMPLDLEDYISFDASTIRKLHINTMTAKQLSGHPYIRWTQAKQIADSVRMFGPIKNWDELLFLSEFTEADRARLEPYISFD